MFASKWKDIVTAVTGVLALSFIEIGERKKAQIFLWVETEKMRHKIYMIRLDDFLQGSGHDPGIFQHKTFKEWRNGQ